MELIQSKQQLLPATRPSLSATRYDATDSDKIELMYVEAFPPGTAAPAAVAVPASPVDLSTGSLKAVMNRRPRNTSSMP